MDKKLRNMAQRGLTLPEPTRRSYARPVSSAVRRLRWSTNDTPKDGCCAERNPVERLPASATM